MKGASLSIAFNRPHHFQRSFESLLSAANSSALFKVVVFQTGDPNTERVIDHFKPAIDRLICVDGSSKSVQENINFNRFHGYRVLFDELGYDWVLSVEDDVQVAFDAITFTQEMFDRYSSCARFRGVNLGSFERKSPELNFTYSLLRYGLHGQAGAIGLRTWKHIRHWEIDSCATDGWDGLIEGYLKTGFMATPNTSRFLDEGWIGTHTPSNQRDPYYTSLAASFMGTDEYPIAEYLHRDILHSLRKDAVIYKKFNWFEYQLRNFKRYLQIRRKSSQK